MLPVLTTFLYHSKPSYSVNRMEGSFHFFFFFSVSAELERNGYDFILEPAESPFDRITWNYYRPDIFGISSREAEVKIVLAECETEPNIRRMGLKTQKIRRWLSLQKRLNEKHDLRLLLAIPSGKLKRINTSSIRSFWDIWIINDGGGIIYKIPRREAPD